MGPAGDPSRNTGCKKARAAISPRFIAIRRQRPSVGNDTALAIAFLSRRRDRFGPLNRRQFAR